MDNIDISKQNGIAKSVLEAKAKNEAEEKGFSDASERRRDEWKSPEIDKLAEALAKAQSEMEGAKKESTNPFFKSSYADLHAVIKSAFPHLSKHGLSVSQGNEMIMGAVCITTTLMHSSGQWLRSKVKLPVEKKTAQGIGAAITYGRRYGLSAIVGIAQYDDDAQSIS
tara:strand:+ start:135 stop:638 length:504 start_codon:yes stop_codon:yes gene_type:complete